MCKFESGLTNKKCKLFLGRVKISSIAHCTHLQSHSSQLTTRALQKSAILPTHPINIEEEKI